MMGILPILTGVALLSVRALSAHVSKYCPSSDVCYELNIPETTANSGSGDIYFQISGSSSYSWIGLGQGNQMAGANIFVIYADGTGNVTLSPRLGKGQYEPLHDTSADVTLLEGSGVSNGKMIANIKCSNCAKWDGGSMDFSSSSASWIHASLSGNPIDSGSPSAGIQQHTDHGAFNWDLTKAQGGNDVNPFVSAGKAASPTTTSASASSTTPAASSSSSAAPMAAAPASVPNQVVIVHGAIASIAFLALFPIGAILIRVPGLSIWAHASVQAFAYIVFIVAAGLGIYIAKTQQQLSDSHPIIGMLLFGILFFQPALGLIHHQIYKKTQKRTIGSYAHIWVGRLAIILGIINGGLGLKLAAPVPNWNYIAYGVVAGVMGTAYLAAAVFGEVRRGSEGKGSRSNRSDI